MAALVLAEQTFDQFAGVKLVEPFKVNLDKKKKLMKVATQQFDKLVDYEVGDVTAAATFYLAEIYADFSKDLKESERPAGQSALEREEYELALEDQAYPFEEKAIAMHKKNLELISLGVYNDWIDKSLQKLAEFIPARYDKPEEDGPVIASPDSYLFVISRPESPAAQTAEPKQEAKRADAQGAENAPGPGPGVKPAETNEAAQAAPAKQDAKPTETPETATAPESKQDAKPAADENAASGAKPAETTKAARTAEKKQEAKTARSKGAGKGKKPAQEKQKNGDKGDPSDAAAK